MLTLLTVLLFALAMGLIAAGFYYQINREELASDPVLIRGCYLGGSVLILGNLVAPFL